MNAQAGDALGSSERCPAGITAIVDANGQGVTLTGLASRADYEAAIEAITFSTTNSSTTTRNIAVNLFDGSRRRRRLGRADQHQPGAGDHVGRRTATSPKMPAPARAARISFSTGALAVIPSLPVALFPASFRRFTAGPVRGLTGKRTSTISSARLLRCRSMVCPASARTSRRWPDSVMSSPSGMTARRRRRRSVVQRRLA